MNIVIITLLVFFILIIGLIFIFNSKLYLDFEFIYDSQTNKHDFKLGIRLLILKIFSYKSKADNNESKSKTVNPQKKTKGNKKSVKAKKESKILFIKKHIKGIYDSIIRVNKFEMKIFSTLNSPDKNALLYGTIWWLSEVIRVILETYFVTEDVDIRTNTSFNEKNHVKIYISGIINVKITHTIWETILYVHGGKKE
jgi:hypothetical protein